jgi:hypothetical protein
VKADLPLYLKLLTHIKMAKIVKSELRSFKDFPLSAKEIKEIEDIQKEKYWNRKPLKEAFCDRNSRLITEVNEYFKKNKRPPDGGTGKRKATKKNSGAPVVDTSGSMRAPKEQVIEVSHGSFARVTTTGEIRVKYKSLRVEDGDIIFEI